MTKLVTIVALLFAASPAFADDAPTSWTPSDPGSYRLEVLALDASAVAGVAMGHNSATVVGLSIATYALGAPILHLAHHRPGNAFGSFVLRAGLPVVAAAVGWSLAGGYGGNSEIPSGAGGAALGLVVGVITASSIDIGVLSKAEPAPQVAPAITPTAHGGMTVGLTGSF